MQKPRISIIVAVTNKNAAIGNGGKLLFRISDDLRRFKALTLGHPIIMGRKTYESIGHPLPERTNIIITRNPNYNAEGVIIASSIEDALEKARAVLRSDLKSGKRSDLEEGGEIFIIGGGEIYKQALPLVDKLYLTIVESDAEGDVFFPNGASPSDSERLGRSRTGNSPNWRKDFTKETFREERTDPKTGLRYTWIDLERG